MSQFVSRSRSAFRSDRQILIVQRVVFAVEQSWKAIRAPSFACNYRRRAGIVLPSESPVRPCLIIM